MELLGRLLSLEFMPHGYCYQWNPWIVWLHVLSDALIAVSYYCIPFALVYLVRKRRDIPFNWIFWMFSIFILACGTTHLMEIWTVWHGNYLLSGMVKAVTAAASVTTAVMLVPLIPKAISLPSPLQLQSVNLELERQIVERKRAEATSRQLNEQLEKKVARRTLQLEKVNDALRASEGQLRTLLDGVTDYAVYRLDPGGHVESWNAGAARLKGYATEEVLGKHISMFYTPEDQAAGKAQKTLEQALIEGRSEAQGRRVRKDGSIFWAHVVILPIYDAAGTLRGFSKVLHDTTERKRMEDALVESQGQLASIIASAMDAILAIDQDQKIVLFNAAAEKMFGRPAKEMLGRSLDDLIPRRFRTQHQQHIRQFGEAGVTTRSMGSLRPLWGLRATGGEFPIEASISQAEIAGKRLYTVIIRDVTERKLAEEKLREQARVLDLSQVLVRDLESRIVFWSSGMARLCGFSSEEAAGKISHDLLHTQFPQPLADIKIILEESGTWEGELIHRTRDGRALAVASRWVLYRDADGRPKRILESCVDVSERRRVQRALEGQREELERQARELARSQEALENQTRILQSVLDSMGEGLIAADRNGKVLIWNRAARDILGRGAADLATAEWTSHYELFLPDGVTPFPTAALPLVRAISGEASVTEMLVHNPKQSERLWIEVNGRPLKDDSGEVRGGVVAFRDISAAKTAEREIRQLNEELEQRVIARTAELKAANTELEAFTYSVSHDLRAPLRHIAGFSKILVEDLGPALPAEAQHHLQRIEEGTKRMGTLVDELLNLARVGRHALSLQRTGLDSVVEEVRAILQPDFEGRQVEWKVAPLPFVQCDAVLIKQVFQNLLANALKFTRPRNQAVIEIGQRRENEQVVIFVRDNGVGFSMKYSNKLFGVFQRLHRAEDFEGTGVGLATVQRIVQKHGGRVWAESEIDQGATFCFALPFVESDACPSDVATQTIGAGI